MTHNVHGKRGGPACLGFPAHRLVRALMTKRDE